MVVAILGGCAGAEAESPALIDGSAGREAPVELEGVDAVTVLTAARVTDADAIEAGSPAETCLRGPFAGSNASGAIVTRVGVNTESVTFRESDRSLLGCDNSLGSREGNRRWCGSAYGMLYGGRLRDPRLSISCVTPEETLIGSAWVQPSSRAHYVVVHEPGFAEVYPVTGDLPVRVATAGGAKREGSRASFELSEHDAAGKLLRRYRLDAFVAG